MRTLVEEQPVRFRDLEGHRVSLTLSDGARLDDVTVVSAGRGGLSSLWLDVDGIDVFIHRSDVIDARDM
jgi:hypothetical protein